MRNPLVKISKAVLMTAAALITCAPPVKATNYYWWDTNNTTTGVGGSATWSGSLSADKYWAPLSTSYTLGAPPNNGESATVGFDWAHSTAANVDAAVFSGISGTATILDGKTFYLNQIIAEVDQIIARDTSALGTGRLSLLGTAPAKIDVLSGKTLQISANLVGGFTKIGPGTVDLQRLASSLGAMTLSAGTLKFSTSGPASMTSLVINGEATLSGQSISTISSDISVTNSQGTTATVSSIIAGTKGLTKTGAGDLLLEAINSYSGLTTINAGRLILGAGGTLAGSVKLSGSAGASPVFDLGMGTGAKTFTQLTLSGSVDTLVTRGTISSPITVDASAGKATIESAISGANTLAKSGLSTLALSGANTGFSGPVNLTGGTLSLGSNSAIGTGKLSISAGSLDASVAATIYNPIDIGGSFTFLGTSDLTQNSNPPNSNGAILLLNGATITVSARTLTLGGVIDDGIYTYGLTKAGQGTLILSGANTYRGLTTINAGTLGLGPSGSLAGAVTIAGTAGEAPVLDLSSTTSARTFSALKISGTANIASSVAGGTLSNTPITVDASAGTATISSAITGTSSVTKSGLGSLLLSASNDYSGATSVSGGTLTFGAYGALTGSLTVSGGTVDFGNISTAFSFSSLRLTLAGTAVTGGVIDNTFVEATFAGATPSLVSTKLTGSQGVSKSGSGTLVLSGNNTYSGATTLTNGTLSAGNDNAFGGASSVLTISSNATLGATVVSSIKNPINLLGNLNYSGPSDLSQSTGAITLSSTSIITVNTGTFALGGVIDEKTGVTPAPSYGITKEGTGTLVLNGANAYNGMTTINAGTLRLGASGVLPQAVTVGAGTLDIGLQTETTLNAGTITLSGAGSIVGGILKNTAVSVSNTTGVATISSQIIGDKAVQKTGAGGELRLTGDVASKGALGGINSFTISSGTVTVPNYTNFSGTYAATGGTSNFTGGAYLKTIVFGDSNPTLSGGAITTSGDFSIGTTAGLVWIDATLAGASKIYYSGRDGFVILKKPSTLTGDVNGVVLEATNSLGNMIITAAQTSWDGTKIIKNSADLLIGVDEAFGSAVLEINGGRLLANSPANTVWTISSPVSLKADMVLATWNSNVGGMTGTYTSPLELKGDVYLNQGTRTITASADLTLSGPISGGGPGLAKIRGGGLIINAGTKVVNLTGDIFSKGALGGISSFEIKTGTVTVPGATSMEGTYTATGGTSNFTGGAYLKSIVFGDSNPTLSGGAITTSGDFSIGTTAGLVWIDATLAGASKIYYSGRDGFVILKKPSTLTGDVNGVVLEATNSLGNMIITAAQTSWDGTKIIKNSADLLIGVDEAFGSAVLEINGGRLLANSPANTVWTISSPVSLKADMVLATWNSNVGGMTGTYTSPLELKGDVYLNQGTRTITASADLTLSGPISGGGPGLAKIRGGGLIINAGTKVVNLTGDIFSKGALGGISSFEIKTGTVTVPGATSMEGTYTATGGTSNFTGGAYLKSIVFGGGSPTLSGGAITTNGDFVFSHTVGTVTLNASLAGPSRIIYNGTANSWFNFNALSSVTGLDADPVIDRLVLHSQNPNQNLYIKVAQSNWNSPNYLVKNSGDLALGVDDALGKATLELIGGRLYSDSATRKLGSPVRLRGASPLLTLWDWSTWNQDLEVSGSLDLGGAAEINNASSRLTLSGIVSGGSINKTGGADLKLTNEANSFNGLTISDGTVSAFGNSSSPAGNQLGVGNVIVTGGTTLSASGNLNVGGNLEIYHTGSVILTSAARMDVSRDVIVWGDQSSLLNGQIVINGDLRFNGYEQNLLDSNGALVQGGASVTSDITVNNLYKFTYGYGPGANNDGGTNWGEAVITGKLIADKIIVVGDPTYWNISGQYGQASLGLHGKSTVRLVSLENDGSLSVYAGALGATDDNPSIIQVSDVDQYRKDRLGRALASTASGSVSFDDAAGTPSFFGTFRIVGANSLLRLFGGSLNTTARLEGNGTLQRESSVGTYNFIQTDGGFTGRINVIGGDLRFTNPRAPASGASGFNPSLVDIQGGSFWLNLDDGISTSLASGGFVSAFAPLTWDNTIIKGDSYFRKQGLGELVLSKASPEFNGHVVVHGGILTLQMAAGQQNGLLGQATVATNSAQSLTLTADADSRSIGGTFRLLDVASGSPTQKFTTISITTATPNMGAAHRIILGSGANLQFTAASSNFKPAAHVLLGVYGIGANSKITLNAAAGNLAPLVTLGANAVIGSTDFAYTSSTGVAAPSYVSYDSGTTVNKLTDYLSVVGSGATEVVTTTTAKGIKFSGAAQVLGKVDSLTNQTQGVWSMDGILYAANAGGSTGNVRIGVGSLTAASAYATNVSELVIQQWNAGDLIIDSKITNLSATTTTSLLKAGSGSLVLTNGNSDYKGGTYVIQGHLDINASSSFFGQTSAVGASTSVIYVNGRGGDPSQSGASIGTSAANGATIANALTSYEVLNYSGDSGKYLTIKGAFTGEAPASRGYSEINVITGGLRLSGAVNPSVTGAWLKKTGPGILEIGGVSSYAGTEVIGGKLIVMSSLAAGKADGAFGLYTRPNTTVQFGLDGFATNLSLPGGTTTAGSTSMVVSDAAGLTTGMFISGTGITAGTYITGISVAPVALAGGVTNSGSNTVTVSSAAAAFKGMIITGDGIPANTTVTAISGATLTLSKAATATATGLSFSSVKNTLTLSQAATATSTNPLTFSAGNGGVKLTVGKMTLGGGTLLMDISGNPTDTSGFDSFVSKTDFDITAATTIKLRQNNVLPFTEGRYLLGQYSGVLHGDTSLLSLEADPSWGLQNEPILYFSADKKVYAMLGAGFRQLYYQGAVGNDVWKTADTASNFITDPTGRRASARFYTSDFVILDDAVSGSPKTITISGAVAPTSLTVMSGNFELRRGVDGDRFARLGSDGVELDAAPALYVANGTLTLNMATPAGAPTSANVGKFNQFSKVVLQGGVLELKGNYSLGPVIDTVGVLRYLSEIKFTGGTLRHFGGADSGLTDYSSLFSSSSNQLFKIDTNGFAVRYDGHFGSSGSQLWKVGGGTLSLSAGTDLLASTNYFPGGVRLKGGALELLSTRALGSEGEIIFEGGTLKHSAATTDSLGSYDGNAQDYSSRFGSTPNQAVSIDTAGRNVAWAYGIKGAGTTSFAKIGLGMLTMNAASTHVGDNTLYQGGLKIGNPRALGYGVINLTALNITDRPTFDASSLALPNNILYQSANVSLSNMANYAGTLSIATGVTLTDAQPIGGTINVLSGATLKMEAGAAVTNLAGQGAVSYRSTSATLQSAPAYTGLLTVQNASTFDVHFAFGGSITAMAVDSAALTLTSGNVDGAITSDRTVRKLGTENFPLAGSNTFTGALNLEGGRLLLRSTGAINGTGPVSFLGGTLVYDYAASNTIDASARATGAAKVEVSEAAGTATWASVTAATTLEKSGVGTLRLTAQDNFTSVKIYGGALALGMNGATNGRLFALPSTGKRIEFLGGSLEFREGVSAAVSDYSNYVQSTGTQSFRIGSFGSAITFASTFGDSTDSLIISGDVTGSFVLGAANSWAGIAVGSGKLGLGATGAFGGATTLLTVTGTGIVDFQNRTSANPMALNASGKHLTNAANYTGLITVGTGYEPWADERIGGTFQVGSGAKLRMKTGGDVVAITGNGEINYEAGLTGNTSLFTGVLRTLPGATYDLLGDFGGSLDASTYSNSTLKLSAGSLTGNLQAAQLVEKHTAGVVTLNGDAIFSGGLSVTGGTLAVSLGVNDDLQTGVAGVSISAGARMELRTLVKAMTLTPAVTVQSGGAFAKQGSMVLDLSGVNSFNGDLELQQGTVALKSAAAIGGTGKILFTGGTLQYSSLNNTDISGRIDLARSTAIKIDTGNAPLVMFAGIGSPTATGANSLTKSGSTVLSITGPSYYSGGTTLSAGELAVGHGQALGTGALTLSAGRLAFQGTSAVNLLVGGNLTVNSGSMLKMRIADLSSSVPSADSVTMSGGLLFAGTGTRTLWLSSLAGGTAPRDIGDGFYKLFQVGGSAPAVDLTKFAVTWAGGGPRQQRKEFIFSQNSLNPLEYGITVQGVTLADLIWVGNPTNLSATSGNWQEAQLGSFRGEDQQFFDLDRVTFDNTSNAKDVYLTGIKSVGYRAGLLGVNPAQILITESSSYRFRGDKGVTADSLSIDAGSQLELITTGGGKFKTINLGGNLVLNAGSTLEAPLANGINFSGGRLVYATSTQDLSAYFAPNAGSDFKIQVDAGASVVSFANGLGGLGSTLLKYGTGELRLGAASTYDGGTTIAEGKLTVAAAAALGSGDVDLTGGDLDVAGRNPFTTNGLSTINIRSAASALTNFSALTNRISIASGVSYDWTSGHQGELQVLGAGKVNLNLSGNIVSLTGNKATDYYAGGLTDASAYTGYMNVKTTKTLALASAFGGSLDVNAGAWLSHSGGVVHSLRGVGTVNYASGSYADATLFGGLLKVLDGRQYVLNQDFGGSIDSTQSDVTNPANVGLLLNGGILQQNLTAHAVTVNGDVELKGTGNVTGKMTLNSGAFLRLADTIALIPQAGLQIDFKGGVLGMSALYSRDISPYIIETTDRIRINTDGYGQPANVTFASQLKAAGLDKSGDGTLTLMSATSEFRDGEINVLGGTLKAGADDSFGRNRNTGIPGDAKLSRVHVNGATAVLDLNAKRVYNDIFFSAGDIKNASNYHGTISLAANATLKLDEPADFNGSIQSQAGNLTLVKGRFVGNINTPAQVSIFSGLPYSSPTKKVVLQGSRASDEIELSGSNNFYVGTDLSSGIDYTGLEILKGTLIVGSLDALGNAGGIDFLDGIIRFKDIGVLHRDISSRITSANAASEANFEVDANAQVTFASGLDSHGMIKLGAGTLNLTGWSNYSISTDKTLVREGTLQLSGQGRVDGGIVVSAGAKLQFDLDSLAYVVSNGISGAGTVEHANAYDLNLDGVSTFTGNLTITGGGRLIAGSDAAFGSALAGYVMPGANATVDFGGQRVGRNVDFRDASAFVVNAANYSGTLFVRAGVQFNLTPYERFGGTVDLENGSLYIYDSAPSNDPWLTSTVLAKLKGAGAVDYDGGTIDDAQEYTGTLTIRAGNRYNVAKAFGGSFSLSDSNTTLVLESGSIAGSVAATGSAHAVRKETAETFVLNGSNDLSAGLVVNDGKLILRGHNILTGGVTINGGVLELAHANALGSAGDIVFAGAYSDEGNGWIRYTAESQQDISSRILIQDNCSINIDTNAQNIRFASVVDSGPYWADLIKKGAGDLILSPGANSSYGFSYIKVREGRLVLDSAGALGDPSLPANQFQIWFEGGRLRHTINNTLSYAGRIVAVDGKDVSIEVDSGASVVYGAGVDGYLSTLRKFGDGSLTINGNSGLTGQNSDLSALRLGVAVSSWIEQGTLVAGTVGALGANTLVVGNPGSTSVAKVELGGLALNNEIVVMNSAAQIKGAHGFIGQVYIPEAVNFIATSTIGSDDGFGTLSTTRLEVATSTLTIAKDATSPGSVGSVFNVVGNGKISFASGVNGKFAADASAGLALLPSTSYTSQSGDYFSGDFEIQNGANINLNTDLNNKVQLNTGGKLGLAINDVWYEGSRPGSAELDVVGAGTIEKNTAGVTNLHGALGSGFTGTYVVSDGILKTVDNNALGSGRVIVKGTGQLDMNDKAHDLTDVVIVDAPHSLIKAGTWGVGSSSTKYIEFLSTHDDPAARTTAHTSLELPTQADGGFHGKVRVTNGVKVDLSNGFYAPVDYYNGTLEQLSAYDQTLTVFGNLTVSGAFNSHNGTYAALRDDAETNKVVMRAGSVIDFNQSASDKIILTYGGRLQNAENYTGDLVIANGAVLNGVAGNFGGGRVVLFGGSQLDVYTGFANKILYHGGILSNGSVYGGELTIDPNKDLNWDGFMNVANGASVGGKIIAPATTSLKVNGVASAVEMYGNTVLSGSGSIANLSMRAGAVLKPGNSPGIMNITNSTVLAGGARAVLEFYDVNATRGEGGYDSFNITGTMDLRQLSPTNRFILNLRSLSAISPDTAGTSLNLASLAPSDYRNFKIFDYQAGTLLRPISYNIADLFTIDTSAFDVAGGITGFYDTDGVSLVGVNRFAIYDDGQGIYLRYGASPLENFASPLTSPLVVNLPAIHVGDPFATYDLTVMNNQTASGTTQGLNVTVTTPVQAPATTNGGEVKNLAAGITDVGGIRVGLQQPTIAGPYQGTVNLTYTSASLDPTSGVQPTVIGHQDVVINGAAYEIAKPVFSGVINLGSVRRGSAIGDRNFTAQNLAITNAAQSEFFGEALDAQFQNPATHVVAVGSVAGLTPTHADPTALSIYVTTAGEASGPIVNKTVDLKTTSLAVLGTGLNNTETITQLQVNGTIYDAAVGNVATADRSINLGVIRVGGTFASRNIAITNDVAPSAWAETLRASFVQANTDASITAGGSFVGLASGASANTALHVTINTTATAGVVGGSARVGFMTEEVNGSGLGIEGVGYQDITVTGIVHDLAKLDTIQPLQNGRVHVGKQFTDTAVRIANDASLSGGYADDLRAYVSTYDPQLLVVTGGVARLAPNAVDTTSLMVRIADYQVVGDKNIDFTISSKSLSPDIQLLSNLDLPDRVVNIQGLVYSGKSVWSGASGAYSDANWSSWQHLGGIPGIDGTYSVGDTATFNGSSAQSIVVTGINPELASITFANSVGTTLSSAATAEKFVLGTGVTLAEVQTQLGVNQISASIDLAQSLRVTTAAGSSVAFTGVVTNTGAATGVEFTGTGVASLATAIAGPKLAFTLSGGTLNSAVDQTFGLGAFSAGTLDAPAATTASPVSINLDSFAKTTSGDVVLGHASDAGALRVALAAGQTATVNGGSLKNNAALQAPLDVSNATLSGVGSSGTLRVLAGSTFAPGNSIGRYTVNGDLTLAAGSTLHIEVSPTSATVLSADVVSATGAAHLGGNLVISQLGLTYPLTSSMTAHILEHASVDGAFDSVAFDNATALQYLTLRPKVRNGVDNGIGYTELYFDVALPTVDPRTVSSIPSIVGRTSDLFLRTLAGDPYSRLAARGPSQAQGVTQASLLTNKDNLGAMVSGAQDNSWVEGYSQSIQANQGTGLWGYEYQVGGVAAGLDLVRRPDWVMGLAFGMSQSDSKHEFNHDKTTSTAYDFGLYTATTGADAHVSFAAFYSRYAMTHTRFVDMGLATMPATGKPDASRAGVSLSYDNRIAATPDSRTYLRMALGGGVVRRSAFAETGDPAIAMQFDAISQPYYQLDLGVGHSRDLFSGKKSWQVFGEAMITRHVVFGDEAPVARFVDQALRPGSVNVATPAYNYLQLEPSLGVSWREGQNSAELKVFAEIRDGKTSTGASVNYRIQF